MTTYKTSHQGTNRGIVYDDRYNTNHTGAMWRLVEKPLLLKLFAEYGGDCKSCLDFACGTGRITALLHETFTEVVGLDISTDMLLTARKKYPNTSFVCGDLTTTDDLVGTFDVVTSFRFFPNAEADLRESAMAAIAPHLRPGGVMIVNNHQNAHSLLGRMRRMNPRTIRPFMNPAALPDLLKRNGLIVERRIGFGFIPIWKNWGIVPPRMRTKLEKNWIVEGAHTDWAQNIIYVARKTKT